MHTRLIGVGVVTLTCVTAAGVQAATPERAPAPRADTTRHAAGPLTAQVREELAREPLVVTPVDGPTRTVVPVPRGLGPGTLPAAAAAAYLFASRTVHEVAPECRVSPSLLAGLGRVTSDHGRIDTADRWRRSTARDRREGAPTKGRPGRASTTVEDTDSGVIDGDTRSDHPVGPMQMLPAMWASAGVDADGDGERNPRDLADQTLGSAVYLCAAGGAGRDERGLGRALRAWNSSPAFSRIVLRLARDYDGRSYDDAWRRGRALTTASAAATADLQTLGLTGSATFVPTAARSSQDATPDRARPQDAAPVGDPTSAPAAPTPSPSRPGPSKDPSPVRPGGVDQPGGTGGSSGGPTPTEPPANPPAARPEPVASHVLSGRLGWSAEVWSVGGESVDAGGDAVLAHQASADHDRDGEVETNLDELTGLLGAVIAVEVADDTGRLLAIGVHGYAS